MSDFKNELEQEVEFINDLISRYLPDETGLDKKIREAMNYSVNAGGKRVRPMLMLEVYKLCGGDDWQVVYPFMAALECIHSYSLVHDDLPAMDNDDYRRGRLCRILSMERRISSMRKGGRWDCADSGLLGSFRGRVTGSESWIATNRSYQSVRLLR